MADNKTIKITILGRAAHGAHTEDGLDAIAIAAQVITTIQQIMSRRSSPVSQAVVSITTIQGGGVKENIIADRVELGGTIRSTGGDSRTFLIKELDAALSVSRAMGATCELEIKEGYAATNNDVVVTQTIREAVAEVLGSDHVIEMPFDTWAEDFDYMTGRVPGSMF